MSKEMPNNKSQRLAGLGPLKTRETLWGVRHKDSAEECNNSPRDFKVAPFLKVNNIVRLRE